nr:aldehyde dehydrogenase family protein [Bacillus subtilis]
MKKDVQDKFAGILQTVVNAGFMEDDHTPDRERNLRRSSMTATSTASKICSTMPSKEGRKWCSAAVFDASDRTISPTVLKNVTPDMKIMQEEIFAPILPMMNYEDIDEVIDYVNDRDKPLALYVFSKNQDLIDNVLQHTTSGNAAINDVVVHFSDVNLPFGGCQHKRNRLLSWGIRIQRVFS